MNEKDSAIDKAIRFYQIIHLKSRLASLNKKKLDIEVEIENELYIVKIIKG